MLKFDRYELGYNLLVTYIYILLFGSWIMKISGIPSSVGLTAVAGLDVVPLGIWFLSNPSFRLKANDFFVDTLNFWLLWIVVLGLLLVASVRHGGSFVPSLVHWGALVRYIPIAYIVISLNKHLEISSRLIKHLRVIATVLLFIGYVCIALGDKATFFLPLLPLTSTGERETLEGNYSAVFANTIDYGFILMLLYTIFIYKKGIKRSNIILLTLVFLIPIFKTGSAISTLVFLIIAFFRITQGLKIVRFSMITFFVIILSYLGYVFWDLVILVIDNARLSRLGMLTLTAPDFLAEKSLDTFFGVGNDGYVVLEKINGYEEQVFMLKTAEDGNISAFGDVFWVALLVFHGLVGLSIIVFLYYKLFKSTAGKLYIDSSFNYDRIIKWFFFTIVIFAFLNQVLVVKTFALVFWIFLAITYLKVRRSENFTNK